MTVVITGGKEGAQKEESDPLLLQQQNNPYPVLAKPSSSLQSLPGGSGNLPFISRNDFLPWPVWFRGRSLLPCTERSRFNSQSGRIPSLCVQSPFDACAGGSQSMFLSHTDVSLFLSVPDFL